MKKKITPKKVAPKKTVKRTAPRASRTSSADQTILFRRIVIISACLVLFVGVFATADRGAARSAVQGVSVMAGMYNQTTINLPKVSPNDFTAFNIYYGTGGQFTNAVRKVPVTNTTYTISYLKKNTSYQYKVVGLGKDGKEHVLPAAGLGVVQTFTNISPM